VSQSTDFCYDLCVVFLDGDLNGPLTDRSKSSGHRILRYAIGGIWPSQPAALRDWGFGHPRGEVTVLRHFPPILVRFPCHLFRFPLSSVLFCAEFTQSPLIFVQI